MRRVFVGERHYPWYSPVVRGHRDVEWDCVAVETVDAFRAADEVLQMMSTEREQVAV